MIKKTFLKTIALCVVMAVLLILVSLSTKPTFRTASAQGGGTGNVFGYAWSSNIGWIKMNSCDSDVNGFGTNCPTNNNFGVNINATTGAVSGYAWSENIGWISFGSDNPVGVAGASSASLSMNGNTGTFSGWARAVAGSTCIPNTCGGWDGWVSLSGTASNGATYSTTYSSPNILGYAWGGDVVGWIQFGNGSSAFPKVTYGAATPVPFNFTITATPSNFTTTGTGSGAFTHESTINLNLTGDNLGSVTLATPVVTYSGGATAANFSVTLGGNSTCSVSCAITLTINGTGAVPGSYAITISANTTGTTGDGIQTKSVVVMVNVGSTASTIVANCTTANTTTPLTPPYYVGRPITRNFDITSGSIPYSSVLLTGTNIIPTSGQAPNTSNGPDGSGVASYTFVKTYSTTGVKLATVTVTDNTPPSNSFGCPPITVFVNPNTNEI